MKAQRKKAATFEAVENLAKALKEVQKLEKSGLAKRRKASLIFIGNTVIVHAELMRDTEETAPFAARTMRKGLPILDRNLKELLEEIQEADSMQRIEEHPQENHKH